jgi:hypothetical protein
MPTLRLLHNSHSPGKVGNAHPTTQIPVGNATIGVTVWVSYWMRRATDDRGCAADLTRCDRWGRGHPHL